MSEFSADAPHNDPFIAALSKLPLASEMAQWDRLATDFGIPESMLMENAGRAAFEVAVERFGSLEGRTVWLFLGGGNNGGDAAVMARHILDAGGQAIIFCVRDATELAGAPAFHLQLALKNGAVFHRVPPGQGNLHFLLQAATHLPCLVVDALLGTGFQGSLKAPMLELIQCMNEASSRLHCPILSVDIPSGLNADTSAPCPEAVRADITVTLAAAKPGLLLPTASAYTGIVVCRAIGIPRAIAEECRCRWRLLSGRSMPRKRIAPANSHKSMFGHVLVIGGAQGYAGAAHLAAAASLRNGAGLATVCSPEANLASAKGGWPEIMTLAAGHGRDWPQEPDEALLKAIANVSAIVLGPGMGRTDAALSFVRAILSLPGRPAAVVDADALTILGTAQASLHDLLDEGDIVTPHPGEAAALLRCTARDVQNGRADALDALCKRTKAVVILKGAGTLVGQGYNLRFLCPYDIPQLAIGGSGDVLAGCAGANLASHCPYASSTPGKAGLAVINHAMAALSLAQSHPDRGFLASELVDALPHAAQFAWSLPEPMQGVLP